MTNVARSLLTTHGLFESFYIANLGVLHRKIDDWKTLLPNVTPYYAMKCNPDKEMLKVMVKHGFGFDCASRQEIDLALSLGVDSSKIGFFHPVKSPKDIKYAFDVGVTHTSFDNMSELPKVSGVAPNMKCLLRLKVDNPTARVQLGKKYGAQMDEYRELVDCAKELGVDIVGTTFHVGSASKDPEVFAEGIKSSREVFDYIKSKGFINCNILDIGGGFTSENFEPCAVSINRSIEEYFGDLSDMQMIAEPGRFFAEEVFTFFVSVVGLRKRAGVHQYWVKDGLYGSFNAILYDQQMPSFEVYRSPFLSDVGDEESGVLCESEIMFETCDSCDKLEGKVMLPRLRIGDYLMVKNFGAYTLSAATDFNGINMTKPKIFYIT
jgi:ornithine decarboxylase